MADNYGGKLRKSGKPKMGRREADLEKRHGEWAGYEYGAAGTMHKKGSTKRKPRLIDEVVGELHGMLTSDPTPGELRELNSNRAKRKDKTAKLNSIYRPGADGKLRKVK